MIDKTKTVLLGLLGLFVLMTLVFYSVMGGNLEDFSDTRKWIYAMIAAIGPILIPFIVIKIVNRKKTR